MNDWIALFVLCFSAGCMHSMPSLQLVKDVPEEYMNVSEIIRYYGYPCERHTVTTTDGYLLTIHRMPYGHHGNLRSGGFPVFLQHGFLDSASTWIMNPPSQSLAFILADAGYDVWLGNSRGNFYSTGHVNLTTDDEKYWDFSFDEMAKYDVPACIDYITNITNHDQLYYVGHSQGTTIGFISFEEQQVAAKVKTFFALAPVAKVSHIKGAIKVLADLEPEIEELLKALGVHDFFPSNKLIQFLAQKLCGSSHQAEILCGNIVFLIAGFDTSNLNDTRVPVYLSHLPSGTSVKDLFHFLQMVQSDKFCMYDYGEGNMERYNQTYPPQYNISSVKTPVAIFYAGEDWLSDSDDVRNSVLPFVKNSVVVQYYDSWNHLDFVWGEEANKYLYNVILKIMISGL